MIIIVKNLTIVDVDFSNVKNESHNYLIMILLDINRSSPSSNFK
jgi:hypothetical protein